jgi:hypothetical protein
LKSQLQKKKRLTYDKLVKNIKDKLDEISIHIYKNLIKGAYDRNKKYVKHPLTRKRKPKKYLDVGVLNIQTRKITIYIIY